MEAVEPRTEEVVETTNDKSSVEELQARVESMDKSLYNGLRGLVMLVDLMETAVNPTSEPEDKARALVQVREIINMMQKVLG